MMTARSASADVSSWLSAGGGYGLKRSETTGNFDSAGAMSFAIGVGSDPLASFVIGGRVRGTTYFSLGTDLSFAARVATGGFARGQWGLALDVGPMWRLWTTGEYGRFPLHAMILAGAPWGLQLGIGGEYGNLFTNDPPAQGLVATVEIDLLRLTVMRQGSTDRFWENPLPAGGRKPASASRRAPALAGLLW